MEDKGKGGREVLFSISRKEDSGRALKHFCSSIFLSMSFTLLSFFLFIPLT